MLVVTLALLLCSALERSCFHMNSKPDSVIVVGSYFFSVQFTFVVKCK